MLSKTLLPLSGLVFVQRIANSLLVSCVWWVFCIWPFSLVCCIQPAPTPNLVVSSQWGLTALLKTTEVKLKWTKNLMWQQQMAEEQRQLSFSTKLIKILKVFLHCPLYTQSVPPVNSYCSHTCAITACEGDNASKQFSLYQIQILLNVSWSFKVTRNHGGLYFFS